MCEEIDHHHHGLLAHRFLAGPPPPSGSLTIFCTINAAARAIITSRIRDKSPGDSGFFSDSSSLDCNVSLGAAVVDSSVD